MSSYFISGANRGIGLAIVQKLLKEPGHIVVTGVRDPSGAKALNDLKAEYASRLHIVPFDLSDPAKIEQAAKLTSAVLLDGLDYLINNAAVSFQALTTFENMDFELFEKEFHLNVVMQIFVIRTFLPLVRKGRAKKVVFMSSNLGSIEIAPHMQDLSCAYATCKAALNMVARKWGSTLKAEGITAVTLHPGWVETDMGQTIEDWVAAHIAGLKMITTEQSADDVIKVITEAKLEDATSFFNHDGSRLPW